MKTGKPSENVEWALATVAIGLIAEYIDQLEKLFPEYTENDRKAFDAYRILVYLFKSSMSAGGEKVINAQSDIQYELKLGKNAVDDRLKRLKYLKLIKSINGLNPDKRRHLLTTTEEAERRFMQLGLHMLEAMKHYLELAHSLIVVATNFQTTRPLRSFLTHCPMEFTGDRWRSAVMSRYTPVLCGFSSLLTISMVLAGTSPMLAGPNEVFGESGRQRFVLTPFDAFVLGAYDAGGADAIEDFTKSGFTIEIERRERLRIVSGGLTSGLGYRSPMDVGFKDLLKKGGRQQFVPASDDRGSAYDITGLMGYHAVGFAQPGLTVEIETSERFRIVSGSVRYSFGDSLPTDVGFKDLLKKGGRQQFVPMSYDRAGGYEIDGIATSAPFSGRFWGIERGLSASATEDLDSAKSRLTLEIERGEWLFASTNWMSPSPPASLQLNGVFGLAGAGYWTLPVPDALAMWPFGALTVWSESSAALANSRVSDPLMPPLTLSQVGSFYRASLGLSAQRPNTGFVAVARGGVRRVDDPCAPATTDLSSCQGTLDAASLLLDWKFAPKWDAYAGTLSTRFGGDMDSSYLANNNWSTTAGVRFRW